MELSPFPFQGPLDPRQVRGRDDLLADLARRIAERRVTALVGPRRYGKTTVLRRLASEKGRTVVWVDLYEVTSIADVAARFDQALAVSSGGVFGSLIERIAATLSVNLGVLRIDLRGPARDRPDPALSLSALLEVLVAAASRHQTLLVIDEFSFISRIPEAAGMLRTALQHHYRELGIVFAGSQRAMMRTLFTSRSEPFYGQADLVEIGPLTQPALTEIIQKGFTSTKRKPGPVARIVYQMTGGHPMRAMQYADRCWTETPQGAVATAETAVEALDQLRRSEAEPLERIFSSFTDSEKALLRSVAVSGSVYGAEAALLGVLGGAAARARRKLVDGGDLIETGTGVKITDPFLADWIRGRFPL